MLIKSDRINPIVHLWLIGNASGGAGRKSVAETTLQIQNACSTPDIIARLEASWRHKLIGEAIADKAQLERIAEQSRRSRDTRTQYYSSSSFFHALICLFMPGSVVTHPIRPREILDKDNGYTSVPLHSPLSIKRVFSLPPSFLLIYTYYRLHALKDEAEAYFSFFSIFEAPRS